ncbi:hypothetical protein CVT25_006400 [Psilocybe cyanescens]|uniref:Ricin B lectin domain-containing protein n=1 Tax=Psilocybe cyanescens TaxID=93625 RepID=A0A409X3T0_PSICY|nr:hypothetical protein CVT25_006400 [Psilocybe cyanescens]
MLSLDARFTFLAVICCLSTLCLLPFASVNAAVISRNPGSFSHFPTEARSVNDATSHSQQRVLPWSSRSSEGSSNRMSSLKTGPKRVHKVHRGGHRKRSHKTIIIPTGHGKNYLLSHARRAAGTPQWVSSQQNVTNESNTTSTQSEDTGAPGAVLIQGRQTLGSLYLTSTNGLYTLNASENNETQLFMVNASSSTTRNPLDSNGSSPVYLMIPGLQDSKDYCATYNDSPNKPEPMTLQQCNNYTAPDGTSTSQTFMFNPKSNELRPTWVDGSNSTVQPASISNSSMTTDTASGPQPTSTGLSSRDDSSVNTQNVTLIWDPADKIATADVSETPEDSQDTTSSAITMTRTVTVFQTGSSSSTLTSTSGSPSATGLNVEVVGNTPNSSSVSSASSMSMMNISGSSSSSSSAAPSPSVDAAAIAANIASSASASMSSASASSVSAMASAAGVSPSASATSTADPSSSTFVAAVFQRSPWMKAETR